MALPSTEIETGSSSVQVGPLHETEAAFASEDAHVADDLYVNGTLQADVEETLALAVPLETPWPDIAAAAEPSVPDSRAPQAASSAPFNPLPPLELLAPPVAAGSITEEHLVTAALIEETLAQHGVEVSVSEIRPGPSVTMFGIVPGWNRKAMSARARALAAQEESQVQMEVRNRVKVDSILAREKDLALALAAPTLRIQAPVPGESLVGVEMPNKSSSMVTIRTVMESPEYERMLAAGGLPVALGLASAGEPVALDLLKMPHLLIAGATGSGKSVCINTIISSIICHQDPAKVRMLLVDPKRVELTPYNGIPHLLTPVVVDPDKVVRLLKGAIQEMMRRYKLLEEAGVRNIASYNRSPRAAEEMPYFVICIDELADLMMTASFDVEQALCRLAQLGRATGIHLIVATQRPSVDVLTGLIKANFPSRIAFAVASQVDSRTILDSRGRRAPAWPGRHALHLLRLPEAASRPGRLHIRRRECSPQRTLEGVAFRCQPARVPAGEHGAGSRNRSSREHGRRLGTRRKRLALRTRAAGCSSQPPALHIPAPAQAAHRLPPRRAAHGPAGGGRHRCCLR